MRKNRIAGKIMAVCLAVGMLFSPTGYFQTMAAEVIATVEGTVQSGTTAELLKLSTNEGTMEIKLDSDTDTSACKILLPGNRVTVSVSHGSDGYLHAVRIGGQSQSSSPTIDSSTTTVTGKINSKTKNDILYFDTAQGEMQIKLDPTTNMNGCTVLVADRTYSIACARGSDAFMHAISITDGVTSDAVGAVSSLTPAPASPVTVSTTSVNGTVVDKTKEDLLYLSTSGGEMQIKIDANTDSRGGLVLTPGRKLTVTVYNGSDSYLHAASIVAAKEATWAVDLDSSTSTVTGTVGSKSTENMLYLDTPQGQMELKLDAVKSVTGCKVFVSGKKLSVACARGSDAYMHAVDITAQ